MPDLVPCSACETLVFAGTCVCPHCGVKKACRGTGALGKAALAVGLVAALTACEGGEDVETGVQALYGVALVDNDGDGYDQGEDCNDDDDTIYPGATETAGDSVDSNCDGEDDT